MKQFAILMAGVLAVILFVFMLTQLSSDALGMAVGVVFGVLAGIPSALLVLASSRRQGRDYDEDEDDEDAIAMYYRSRQGERQLGQPFPYQPPVIVLAAPVEQPQVVNNYTDTRSVTIHKPASSVPSIYDRQRQVAAERRASQAVAREEWSE